MIPSITPHDAFAAIQEKIINNHMRNGYIILGDTNARLGRAVRELAQLYELPDMTIFYPIIEDEIARRTIMLNFCQRFV